MVRILPKHWLKRLFRVVCGTEPKRSRRHHNPLALEALEQTFKLSDYRIDGRLPQAGSEVDLTNGTSVTIPLTIYRDTGFSGTVYLSVGGTLPAGVTWTASAPVPGAPAVETRTLTITAAPTLAGDEYSQVTIRGRSTNEPEVDFPIGVRVVAGRITTVQGTLNVPDATLVPGTPLTINGVRLVPGSRVQFPGQPAIWADPTEVDPDGQFIRVIVPDGISQGQLAVRTPTGAYLIGPARRAFALDAVSVPGPYRHQYGTNPGKLYAHCRRAFAQRRLRPGNADLLHGSRRRHNHVRRGTRRRHSSFSCCPAPTRSAKPAPGTRSPSRSMRWAGAPAPDPAGDRIGLVHRKSPPDPVASNHSPACMLLVLGLPTQRRRRVRGQNRMTRAERGTLDKAVRCWGSIKSGARRPGTCWVNCHLNPCGPTRGVRVRVRAPSAH